MYIYIISFVVILPLFWGTTAQPSRFISGSLLQALIRGTSDSTLVSHMQSKKSACYTIAPARYIISRKSIPLLDSEISTSMKNMTEENYHLS